MFDYHYRVLIELTDSISNIKYRITLKCKKTKSILFQNEIFETKNNQVYFVDDKRIISCKDILQ